MSDWTDERITRLKVLWTEGLSASQIAGQLGGVTRNAVIGKVHRLSLSGRAKPVSSNPRPRKVRSLSPSYLARRERPQATGGGIGANISRGVGKAFAKRNAPKIVADLRAKPPKPATEPACRPIRLMKLKMRSCRWPVKEETGRRQLFCGAIAEIGVPYCDHHAKIAAGSSKPEWTPERRAKFLKSTGIGGLAAP